jgi:small-conductance mechanosensitive channel
LELGTLTAAIIARAHQAVHSVWDDIGRFLHDMWRSLGQPPGIIVPRTLGAILIAIATILVGRYMSDRTRRTLLSTTTVGANPAVLLARVVRFAVWTFGAIWILGVYSVPFTALAAVVSVVAIAVSLSFQDVFKNLIAGIYLLAERPFHIGDAITVKGVTGTIEDIEMRVTYLRTDAGEQIVMPNQTVFTEVVVNRSVEGERSAAIAIEVPRSLSDAVVRERALPVVSAMQGVAAQPAPHLQALSITPDAIKWSLHVWLDRGTDLSTVMLAVGEALPEATLSLDGLSTQ